MIHLLPKLARTSHTVQLQKQLFSTSHLSAAQSVLKNQGSLTCNLTGVRQFSSSSQNTSKTTTSFLSMLGFLGVAGGVAWFSLNKNHAHLSSQVLHPHAEEIAKMKNILSKDQKVRTLDERIEFIDTILQVGDEEAQKVKGKDAIAVIGTTNSGKSTFLDYLNGCEFIKVDNRVKVAPHSKQKEIAQIGRGMEPTTICPQVVQIKTEIVCDLPGFSDPRGFEVNIGICDNLRKIYNHAKTVRTVYLIDFNSIIADGGIYIPSKLQLLNDIFNQSLTAKNDGSLIIVITHAEDVEPGQAIQEFKKAAQGFPLPRVYVYDPLMNSSRKTNDHGHHGYISREELFETLDTMPQEPKVNTICLKLSDADEKSLKELGNNIKLDIVNDLHKMGENDLQAANHKLGFFRRLKERFDTEFIGLMHVNALSSFNQHLQATIGAVFDDHHTLEEKYNSYAVYTHIKERIPEGHYQLIEEQIQRDRQKCSKETSASTKNPNASNFLTGSAIAGAGTVAAAKGAAIGSAVASSIAASTATGITTGAVIGSVGLIALPVGLGIAGYAIWKAYYPSEEDNKRNAFFDLTNSPPQERKEELERVETSSSISKG